MLTLSLLAALGYLLGSIPFGWLLVRIFRHEDVRRSGSGNIGATNVIRAGGKGLGALTFLLDAAKGFVAVMVSNLLLHHHAADRLQLQNALAIAGLAAVLGHIFPVWLGFRGGKGVATAFGIFLAISPLAALISLLVFIVAFFLSRYVSLASILGAIAFASADLVLFSARQSTPLKAVVVVVPLTIVLKHHKNISRLLHGKEYRFGKPKPTAA